MKNKKYYVLYLSSEKESSMERNNEYGYWTGEKYAVQGEYFPITEKYISKKTKIYHSFKRAENALNSILENYAYVQSGKIEEV